MEIFHWSGAGIDVRDNTAQAERGRLFNTNERAVRIRNNFIHHNRHGDGDGYGVHVADGAYALIERNVFDENRHAIAGGSSDGKKDFSGYTVRDNLILSGGGLHCSDNALFALTGWQLNCWQTHQIDMHGNKSLWLPPKGFHCCGTAGETMIIERNTILYIGGPGGDLAMLREGFAIKIRGNPVDKVVVDGNIFRHKNRGEAIAQNGEPVEHCFLFLWPCVTYGDTITRPIIVRPNNVFGSNPATELGSCNFFNYEDGQKDQFMATGVTWWARSPKTQQWRYLNTMPERLPQLLLEDVDNDGTCDVAERPPEPGMPPRRYSKNGTEPWARWPPSPTPPLPSIGSDPG